MLWEENIPILEETDNNGYRTEVNVIAGNLKNLHAPDPTPDSWAADVGNDVSILTIKLDAYVI
jgi:hypothetical protein